MANINALSATADKLMSYRAFRLFVHKFNLYTLKKWSWVIFRTVIIVGISYMLIWPFLDMLLFSFMDKRDLIDPTIVLLPKHYTIKNIQLVIQVMDFWEVLRNTVFLAAGISLLQVFSCTLIGYGFARFKFRGNGVLFALVIITLLIPPQTLMIPTFLHYRFMDFFGILKAIKGSSGIYNTYLPFILTAASGLGIKNGLYILMMRQAFKGMGKEIEEAAMMDGAGVFKTFVSIMLPNVKPIITTIFLFSFVWQWNDTYYITQYYKGAKVMANSVMGIADTIGAASGGQISPFYQSLLANVGQLLMVTPLIILYICAQKYFVQSIERAGIIG